MKGACAACAAGTGNRKRLPSAVNWGNDDGLASLLLSLTFPNDPRVNEVLVNVELKSYRGVSCARWGERYRRNTEETLGVCCPNLISTRFEGRVGHSGTQPGRVSLHRID